MRVHRQAFRASRVHMMLRVLLFIDLTDMTVAVIPL